MKRLFSRYALLMLVMLGVSGIAHATTYTSCASVPASPPAGDVIITDSGNCTLPNNLSSDGGQISITAMGTVNTQALTTTDDGLDITVSGTSVTTLAITSDADVQITATSGTISTGDIISNNNDVNSNVLLSAPGNIGTGTITNNGSDTTGGIEIHANTGGTSTAFNIGGGGSNGTGTLDVSTDTGGGSDPYYIPGGIYVTNGTTGSTGGITVNSASDLVLTASASRSGLLILDAKDGTLTLPTGSINTDGATGYLAGEIVLLANTVTTVDGTIISATQDPTATGSVHGVIIAAGTINAAGMSGLMIHADGNGIDQASIFL